MNELLRKVRNRQWAQLITDCNRECAATGMTKKEWCAQHHINTKSFYHHQKVLQDILVDAAANGNDLPEEFQAQPGFVELPLFGPAPGLSGNTAMMHKSPAPDIYREKSPGISTPVLTIRIGSASIELSDNVSDRMLAFVKEVLANA